MTFHIDQGFQPAPPSGIAAMNPNQMVDMMKGVRDIQGQNALGAAYAQAVDPTTGQIDPYKLNQLMASGKAPWLTGQAGIQAGQAVGAQGQGTQAQLEAVRQQTLMMQGFYSQFDMSKPVPIDQGYKALDEGLASGHITPQYYAQAKTMLSHLDPSEQADLRPIIQAQKYVTQNASEQAGRLLGPGIDQQMKMQQWLATPYSWTDQNGQPKQGTYGQFLQERNIPVPSFFPSGNVSTTTTATPPSGPAPSSVTTGRTPVTSGGPSATTTTAPPARVASGGENVPVGTPSEVLPGPVVEGGQKAYQQDQALKGSLGQRISPLQNVLGTLRNNPDLATAGTSGLHELEVIGEQFGMPVGTITTSATAYKELGKYLAQYARTLPGANNSDLARLEAQAATPNLEQGRQAIAVLAAKAIGYERMRSAPVDYFNGKFPDIATAARNSGRYQIETADWAAKQDPVAYAVDEMAPDMVREYVKGLSPAAKDRFWASAAEAHRLYNIDVSSAVPNITLPPPARPTVPPAVAPNRAQPPQLNPQYPPGYTGG